MLRAFNRFCNAHPLLAAAMGIVALMFAWCAFAQSVDPAPIAPTPHIARSA
ncbi:hypothetical protein [Paraburkholderia sacchari]|uniref:hypothetical protein n=1 Tax=Paraburkholderia sacchari TaxID=159450 RepID=UPI001BCD77BE|nr:hypothetical protein [Paraburkholderia sacchari]